VAGLAIGLACVAFATRTYIRNLDWQNEFDLWSGAVKACPESVRARMNLGETLLPMPGRLPDAIAEYEAAQRIRSDPNVERMIQELRAH
jgi:hypothetical protein